MSLILDALKKLDRERAFRRSGVKDIAAEILRNDAGRRRRNFGYWLFGIIAAFLTAGISLVIVSNTGFFAETPPAPVKFAAPVPVASPARESEPPTKAPAAVSLPPPPPDQPAPARQPAARPSPPQPVSPAAGNAPGATPAVTVPGPSPAQVPQEGGKERKAAPPEPAAPKENKPPAPSQPEQKPAPPPAAERPVVSTPALPPRPVPSAPQKSPAAPISRESAPGQTVLKISGIVWHDDPSERKVVINGMVLTEGASIEGMKIVEIQPDRVRLLRDGRPFELAIFP